ncbi:hypothetical protein N0V94_000361 [Neodidymelliopsis sp. IMI 364377]|nr:hypothetical protein N0V94_000361 [Neodidymelliopsis sp. IMI 364377]
MNFTLPGTHDNQYSEGGLDVHAASRMVMPLNPIHDVNTYREAMPIAWTEQDNAATPSTKTLHEAGDRNPAITLTTSTCKVLGQPVFKTTLPLRSRFRDFAEAGKIKLNDAHMNLNHLKLNQHFSEDIELVYDYTQSQETTAALQKLTIELKEHFECLRSEYEGKTSKRWAPLEPWDREDWDWNYDGRTTAEIDEGDWLVEGKGDRT